MRIRFVVPTLLLLTAACRGGTIVTTDGETLDGDIKRVEGGWSVTDDRGEARVVGVRKVKSIRLTNTVTDAGRAAAALASLRRSVEFGDDAGKIVARYQAFVGQTKDAAVRKQAQDDLAVWQDRVARGLVKVGRRWMTPDDRDRLATRLRAQAEQARLLIKDGRDEDAARLVADSLELDPQQVSALYLRGVLETKREEYTAARKTFAAVEQTLPQHAPTLLNVSLILARQKQWGPACASLDQSLAAAPVTRVLLDTAAEFLNLLPPEQRKITAAQRLAKRFFEQDARLQKALAAQDLYRWGGSWVGRADYDKIQKSQADAGEKIKSLEADFAATERGVGQIDQQVAEIERSMHDIEQHSYIVTADGTTVRVPYPRAYYDLGARITQLRADRVTAAGKLDTLRGQARDAQKALPVAPFTGVLTPVDEDGVPLVGPATPATGPATGPTTAP